MQLGVSYQVVLVSGDQVDGLSGVGNHYTPAYLNDWLYSWNYIMLSKCRCQGLSTGQALHSGLSVQQTLPRFHSLGATHHNCKIQSVFAQQQMKFLL